eukprot:scaffold56004_cov57-Phaeocystis_antarctica.AAC.4
MARPMRRHWIRNSSVVSTMWPAFGSRSVVSLLWKDILDRGSRGMSGSASDRNSTREEPKANRNALASGRGGATHQSVLCRFHCARSRALGRRHQPQTTA